MFTKTVKYEDYNGIEREETLYFNLTEMELTELEASRGGGYREYIERITKSVSIDEIIKEFKSLILMSYGKKSDDGRLFIKKPELTEEFTFSPAFDILINEMLTSEDLAANFIVGVLPNKYSSAVKDEISKMDVKLPQITEDNK